MTLGLELEELPTYWRLAVWGELDAGGCSRLRTSIDRVLRYRPELAIVDMSGLEYIDSSGIGVLLSLSRQYAAGEGHIVLVTSEPVRTLLSRLKLDDLFAIAPTMREALEVHGPDVSATQAIVVQPRVQSKSGESGTRERTTQM